MCSSALNQLKITNTPVSCRLTGCNVCLDVIENMRGKTTWKENRMKLAGQLLMNMPVGMRRTSFLRPDCINDMNSVSDCLSVNFKSSLM